MANKDRTYARNRTELSRRGFEKNPESDGVFLLKLVLVVLAGSFWLKFGEPMALGSLPLSGVPAGLLIGLLVIHLFERRKDNRRTFFAVIIIVGILSFFLPSGIVL
jgi:hypothetical protein